DVLVDGVHLARARLRCEKREDPAAGTHVEHGLAGEITPVVRDAAVVRARSARILEHVLLIGEQLVVDRMERAPLGLYGDEAVGALVATHVSARRTGARLSPWPCNACCS